MSWFSSLAHDPIGYAHKQPLKAGALAVPAALAAFFAPEAIAGVGALGEAGAAGLGLGEAGAAGGLSELLGLGEAGIAETGALGAGDMLAEGGIGFGGLGGESSGGLAGLLSGGGGEAFALGDLPEAALGGSGGGMGGAGEAGLGEFAGAGGGEGDGLLSGAPGKGEAGIFDKFLGASKDSFMKNPLGIGLSGAGMGYNMWKGTQTPAMERSMKGRAGELDAQGKQLMSYLQSGTLPPGLQSAVDQATKAAKARIISNHASRGLPTDPSSNSALAQELAGVDQAAITQVAQLGQQLLTTGLSETGLAQQLYMQLIGLDQKRSADIGRSIAAFASALGGGGSAPRRPAYV